MFGLTQLGVIHTAISLVAVAAGLTRGVPAPAGGVLPAASLLAACEPNKHHGRKDRDDDDDD